MNATILQLIKDAVNHDKPEILKELKKRYEEYQIRQEPTRDNIEIIELIDSYFTARKHFLRSIEIDSYDLGDGCHTKQYDYGYFDCEATIEIQEKICESGSYDLPDFRDRDIETFHIITLEYEL